MNEIICPHCGKAFTVDESGYNEIVRQVRDDIFEKEIERNRKAVEREKASELEVLRTRKESELKALETEKDAELERLKSERDSAITTLKLELEKKAGETLAEKDREIAELKAALDSGEKAKELAVIKATGEKDKELADRKAEVERLRGEIEVGRREAEISEKALKEQYEIQLKAKDGQIQQLQDFKARLSTKMVGESLERHCENEFNKIRAAAFPNAYFEKDNETVDGTKGDYVFIERDSDGTEIVSIMFEMKNEMDTTASKHKNEDFFKKLDEDRRKKNCEYAVLVSMLEMDSELYNQGIVDVSYRYEKMYVIRPQFFIPIISLLRSTSMKSLGYRKQLAEIKEQNIDITNFEDSVNSFKGKVYNDYRIAKEKYEIAIKGIDNNIAQLQKIKEALKAWERHMRLANSKTEDLSIKRLTKGNPTMTAKFEALNVWRNSDADDPDDALDDFEYETKMD